MIRRVTYIYWSKIKWNQFIKEVFFKLFLTLTLNSACFLEESKSEFLKYLQSILTIYQEFRYPTTKLWPTQVFEEPNFLLTSTVYVSVGKSSSMKWIRTSRRYSVVSASTLQYVRERRQHWGVHGRHQRGCRQARDVCYSYILALLGKRRWPSPMGSPHRHYRKRKWLVANPSKCCLKISI